MDKRELAKSLKLLDSTPKEINRQREAYRAKLAEIDAEEKRGIWGKVTLDNQRKAAKAERDKTISALVKRMTDAFNYVAQNNAYGESETIDFSDKKLNDALHMVEVMGKDLSVADQAALLNSYCGNIGALRVLEKAFAKNGLALKDTAKELQKPISGRAMEEMKTAIAFAQHYAAKGDWSEDPFSRCRWTMGEFGKQIDRLALEDEAAGVTPYSAVLDALSEQIKAAKTETQLSDMTDDEKTDAEAKADAELLMLQLAREELTKAQANGKNPSELINRQLDKMEKRGTTQETDEYGLEAAYKAAGLPFPKN